MAGIERKELGLAIAAMQRLLAEYQEREALRGVFQEAGRVLKALADADAALPAMEKRKAQLDEEIKALVSRLDEERRNLASFLEDGQVQRKRFQEGTAVLLADEKRKRKVAEDRTAQVAGELADAEAAHALRIEEIRAETATAEAALSAIKAQIDKFKHLAG